MKCVELNVCAAYHGDAVVNTVASQREASVSAGAFLCEVCMSFPLVFIIFLPLSKDLHVRLIGDSNLPVIVSMDVFNLPHLSLRVSWDRLQPMTHYVE